MVSEEGRILQKAKTKKLNLNFVNLLIGEIAADCIGIYYYKSTWIANL